MQTGQAIALDPQVYRPDFPILAQNVSSGAPLAFLDNAASTQRPRQVIEAMTDCYERYYANVHRGVHTLSEASTEAYENARAIVSRTLNSPALRQVIFTAGATAAMNLVARSYGDQNIRSGDVILLTMMEHHANIVPWHQLASRSGCRVEFVPLLEDGTLDLAAAYAMLEQLRPKIFSFTAVSNVLGTINPVADLTKAAHAVGAIACVDAAQAVPHLAIDVQAWDVDFLVFSGHKVCGPTGIGVLYGRESLLEEIPPFLGGGAMIRKVTTEGFEPAGLPEKFEAGTPPIVEAIGLGAALEYVSAIGFDRIHHYEQELAELAHQQLSEVPGLRIFGPPPAHKGGIVSFVLDGVHAHDLAQGLDQRGIAIRAGHHCTMPLHRWLGIAASARASFYFYNTREEVQLLASALHEIRDQLAPKGRRRRVRSTES